MSNLEFHKEKEQEQTTQYGSQLEFKEPEEPAVPDVDGNDDDIEVPTEDQQLDLFGGAPEPVEKKVETKKKTSAKPASVPQKKIDPQKVGTDYTVMYAGHKIPVPQDDMLLEDLRAYLEADYPELSRERAELIIDKEKFHVVPVVKGAKKG